MAEKACRTLGFSYRDLKEGEFGERHEDEDNGGPLCEQGHTFIGVVGAGRVKAPEAKETISKLKQLGIDVIIATGDNKISTKAAVVSSGLDVDFEAPNTFFEGPDLEAYLK